MAIKPEYTGSHNVTLPPDFMDTVKAVVEIFKGETAEVTLDVKVPCIRTRNRPRFLALIMGLFVCLLPADWMTVFY
jgi:hypothetical protein